MSINHPAKRALALELLRFQQSLDDTAAGYFPHNITGYLFELARRFSTFFEQCHVLKAETETLRDSRCLLCDVTGRTIKQGLSLLGIGQRGGIGRAGESTRSARLAHAWESRLQMEAAPSRWAWR